MEQQKTISRIGIKRLAVSHFFNAIDSASTSEEKELLAQQIRSTGITAGIE